jgi:hypothetical protein
MPSDRFCDASQQATLNVPLPMRANHNEVGIPLHCSVEYGLYDVTYLDRRLCLESRCTQLVGGALNRCMSVLLLIFQLGGVAVSHLGPAPPAQLAAAPLPKTHRLQFMQRLGPLCIGRALGQWVSSLTNCLPSSLSANGFPSLFERFIGNTRCPTPRGRTCGQHG